MKSQVGTTTARVAAKILKTARDLPLFLRALMIYSRYREFTMIPQEAFVGNLLICANQASRVGCIVECGVWRGGMSAGMADMIPGRLHFLFDSFEGLPPAREIDGEAATAYQRDGTAPHYFDNCRAEQSFAEKAMRRSAAREFKLVPGWFDDTVPAFDPPEPIAVLRLDGDWYDSTLRCLVGLYPHLAPGGLLIIDDYYFWDGCTRAVHDYLSVNKLAARIRQRYGVCYVIK